MLDLTKLKIGSIVRFQSKRNKDNKELKPFVECKIVYIFKAYQIPKKNKVLKYYGCNVINPIYARVFGPMQNDRSVLKRNKNDYIILYIDREILNYVNLEVVSY